MVRAVWIILFFSPPYFIFLNNCTNSCQLLTKLVADGLVVLCCISAVSRSTVFSLMSFDSCLVLPMAVERLESKTLILWVGVIRIICN